MHTVRYVASVVVVAWIGLLGWNSGCGGNTSGPADGGPDATGSSSGTSSGGTGFIDLGDGNTGSTGGAHACTQDNTVCTHTCAGTTTIKGKVFDPAGRNPVYNVAVWVPYRTPDMMPVPLTCDCSQLYTGGFVGAYALTKADGSFTIPNAPASKTMGGVPIVVQIGKWRYQTSIAVTCGTDNNVPDGKLRLPQGRPGLTPPVEFAGDLPNIAVSTGSADSLECLLTRVGVSGQEYVPGAGTPGGGHVHVYQGFDPAGAPNTTPGAPQSSAALWDTAAHLSQFDAVLLSCEGRQTQGSNPQALWDYGQVGGRVFASHFHYQWFLGQPFPHLGFWYTNSNYLSAAAGTIQTKYPNGNAFPDGKALNDFLVATNSLDPSGELVVFGARHNIDVDVVPYPPQNAIPWINFDPAKSTYAPGQSPTNTLVASPGVNSTLYFSYDPQAMKTESTCGRFVYSDLHVGGNSGDYGQGNMSDHPPAGGIAPSGCNASAKLSNQENALEFMLFDLTSCLSPPGGDGGTSPKGPQ